MIKLDRIRTNDIPGNFRGQDRVDKILDLLKNQRSIMNGGSQKHSFPSNWSPCKDQLLLESFEKCAYCESPTTLVAYGDVEHYRPKSIYWWLAYCYDNYLASCTLCNQKYKKAKFKTLNQRLQGPIINSNDTDDVLLNLALMVTPDPVKENDGRAWSELITEHNLERPFILNPYIDDPSKYFAWEVDHIDKYVRLVPLDDQDDLHCKMVKAAEADLGLNRKELCIHRYHKYIDYVESRLISEDIEVPDKWRDIKRQRMLEILQPERSFIGMLTFFHAKKSDDLSLPD